MPETFFLEQHINIVNAFGLSVVLSTKEKDLWMQHWIPYNEIVNLSWFVHNTLRLLPCLYATKEYKKGHPIYDSTTD